MNETTTSPIIMALLFVLRCLIPLGVLFGVSYLLRRLELVNDRSDDLLVEANEDTPVPPPPLAVIVPEPEILPGELRIRGLRRVGCDGVAQGVHPVFCEKISCIYIPAFGF